MQKMPNIQSIQEFASKHSEILEVNYHSETNTFYLNTKFPKVENDWVDYLLDCLKPYYALLKDFDTYKRREYLNSDLSFPQMRYWEDFISLYLMEDKSSMIQFKHQNGLISEIILVNVNLFWEENEVVPEEEVYEEDYEEDLALNEPESSETILQYHPLPLSSFAYVAKTIQIFEPSG